METQTNNSNNLHPRSTNYFFDWVISTYLPNCIIYSTERSKQIIAKNNLTPSQFLRPFGNFSGTNINFSVGDKFTINLKNFKFDFYDREDFSKFSNNKLNEVLESMLLNPKNTPQWNLQSIQTLNKVGKNNLDPFFQNIKNYSYTCYTEWEKSVLESLQFNEHEMYQQPFANIYVCSISDEKEEIEALKKKDKMPQLIQEGIFDSRIPTMILVLNDKSKEENLTNDIVFKKLEAIRSCNLNSFVVCMEINSNKVEDVDSDIWSNYFHKLEIYSSSANSDDAAKKTYGAYISKEEKENFKGAVLKFFNEYIKQNLQRLVVDLDDEICSNKKGIRNGFLSIFKKSEKVEYVGVYNIYKLTTMEKKLYLLSVIQFYFRDYENAMEHLKLLASDIKSKSIEHYNSILELYTICHFISASGSKKDVELDSPYNNYMKSKNLKNASRAMIIQVKMLEHLKRFAEIPKILIRATGELTMPYITPIFFEKASIYFLLFNSQIRKFIFFQILSAMAYKNFATDLRKYSLNCLGNVVPFFEKNYSSFLRIKEFINSNMGEICMIIEYFEGALKFYKNAIELSTVKNVDQDQALYIRHFLKSLNSIGHGGGLSYVEINYLSIPEIVNNSLLVVEEQDYDIGNIKQSGNVPKSEIASGDASLNWINFYKYSKVELNKTYLSLSENDVMILKNLDNIIENKQNFSNFGSKRNFTANVENKIYVRFLIKNPLNLNLSISSMKLDCDFMIDKNFKDIPLNASECIEYEEKNLLLEKNSSTTVTIFCKPKYPGKVYIKGLEIGLYKIALFKHCFSKRNVSTLYKDHNRSKSMSRKSSSSSNSEILKKFHQTHQSNPVQIFSSSKDISFDIIDDNQDIKIQFPYGKEISLYNNEIFLMPVKIKNSSTIKIKRFCFYFDDKNNSSEEDSVVGQKKRLGNKSTFQSNLLTHVIYKENELRQDNECEVFVPICPQLPGEFYIKVLIKIEEESKYKEIEIKRFIIKLNVKPSVIFNIQEEISFYDPLSTNFNLKVNAYIERRESLCSMTIQDIYFHDRYSLNKHYNWKMLENESYTKLYSVLKMKKSKNFDNTTGNHTSNLSLKSKTNLLNARSLPFAVSAATSTSSTAISKMFENILDKKFKFIPDLASDSNSQHVNDKFVNLLAKDKLLFHFTVKDYRDNDRIVNCLLIYDNIIRIPQVNKTFLKTIFVNSIEVKFTYDTNYPADNTRLVCINISLDKKGLLEISEINSYEVYVNDEDFEFNWVGATKYKILNKKNENDADEMRENLNFCFLTNQKEAFEMSKICVCIIPKNANEKPYVLSNVLRSKMIEID